MADITSANAVFMISVPAILPVPQSLQDFAADDMFDIDQIESTQTMMGVDGFLSGGMVFVEKPMNITLMAGSPSMGFFDAWHAAQQGNRAAYPASAIITFPALQITSVLRIGYLGNYKHLPDAKKILQPRKFQIKWQSITTAPVGVTG